MTFRSSRPLTWKANKLFFGTRDTNINFIPDKKLGGMFRVVYPDGALSADSYNRARVKMHCVDIAMETYRDK